MFTGLIERMGQIASLARGTEEVRVRVASAGLGALERGESIAVDGVCLTVTGSGVDQFESVLSPETLARTTLGRKTAGDPVNLERPLRLGDRLGGHLVQGHVDDVGVVQRLVPEGSGARLRISVPEGLSPFIVQKGSIAVDGISLTVAARGDGWFETALIPETLSITHVGRKAPGAEVNLEVDMMGRYLLQSLQSRTRPASPPITRELLARHGFGGGEVAS